MIEIIYKESEEKGDAVFVKPPKNIRQIGMPRGRHKIYVEDYVYTFLHSAAFEGACQKRAAVLLGKSEVAQDIRYTFINGAVSCDDLVFREDGILFDESCWEYIYKEMKQYFDRQEIIGWFLGVNGLPLELTPMVEAAHRKYFVGRDKVLFLSEPAEREDIFYAYEQGVLQRKEGYYIYYEKNLAMQEYMVSARERVRDRNPEQQERTEQGRFTLEQKDETEQGRFSLEQQGETEQGKIILKQKEGTEQDKVSPKQQRTSNVLGELTENSAASTRETGDRISAEEAIQNYRNMLLERKQEPSSRKISTFLYIAASAAMVILCVIGITTMNNYEKMKQLQETIAVFADFGAKTGNGASQDGVVVETVPGQVTPESQTSGNNGSQQSDAADSQSSGNSGSQQSDAMDSQSSGNSGSRPSGTTDGQPSGSQQPGGADSQQPGGTDTTSTAGQTTEAAALAKTYLDQGYYIVQPGDKLELICKKIYQTTAMMDKLCKANQLDDVNKIYAGQKLILP